MAACWPPSSSASIKFPACGCRTSPRPKRAYVLADNKLALNAGWDKELLTIELQGLIEADYQVEMTGFWIGEADAVLQEAREALPPAPIRATMPVPSHRPLP